VALEEVPRRRPHPERPAATPQPAGRSTSPAPGYAWGVLYVARADEPARHRGAVVRVEASPFAPSLRLLRDLGAGRLDGPAFARAYLGELRHRWGLDPQPFLDLLALAAGRTDGTLVDAWGDEPYAPRRVLAAALKQLAEARRDEERRRAAGWLPRDAR
jgi:hypothetical protein